MNNSPAAQRLWPCLIAFALLLTACGPASRDTATLVAGPSGELPAGAWPINPLESEMRILVYREGPLAALGHNHVISHASVSGYVRLADEPADVQVFLTLPVDEFEVDRPDLRVAEGDDFGGPLDESAVRGTRSNMLGERVLDANRFPVIEIKSATVRGELPALLVAVDIDLRGETYRFEMPATVSQDTAMLRAEGEFSVRQSDLGIEPFSVALGALSVRDELRVKYDLVARPGNTLTN